MCTAECTRAAARRGADQSRKPGSVAEGCVDPPGVAEVAARFDDRGPDSSKWSGVKIVAAFIDLSKPLVCAVNGIAVRCPTPPRPLSPLAIRNMYLFFPVFFLPLKIIVKKQQIFT